MKKFLILSIYIFLNAFGSVKAEPIFHEKYFPSGDGPFPTIVLLHTSGGYKTVKKNVDDYLARGYAIYTPDYYKKHGITKRTRQNGFYEDRESIDKDLVELIAAIKKDPKVDPNNLFAIGYSAGSFPAAFLASSNLVSAASAHYGVWGADFGKRSDEPNFYPETYFGKTASPFLAIHAKDDGTQRFDIAESKWAIIRKNGFSIHTVVFEIGGHPFKDRVIIDRSVDITDKFFREHMKR